MIWHIIDGVEWASDRNTLITRRAPESWFCEFTEVKASDTAILATYLRNHPPSKFTDKHAGTFDPRYAPLLKAGRVLALTAGRDAPAVVVDDEGVAIAYVMPLNPNFPNLNQRRQVNAKGDLV